MYIFAYKVLNIIKAKIFFSITILLLCILQNGCAPNRNREKIIIAGAGKIKSLDPAQANTIRTLQLISALGDTLYKVKPDGSLSPQLAKGLPEVKDNGLTIDITLKDNIYFHDGTPFNAESMKFSIERFINIGTLNYLINGKIKSLETPEDNIIRLKLTAPSSSLIGLLTSINLTPVSPKAYSNHKDKFLNKEFIGTGPYKLETFQNQKQKLIPFSNYWNKKPLNKGIDYINLNNSTSLFGSIRTKEVDVLLSNSIEDIQALALNRLAQKSHLKVGEGPPIEIGYITFRTDVEPLNNILIREALSYSFNRELISKKVSFSIREPLRSIVPPSLNKNNKINWPSYNPQKVKEILKEVGYCEKKILTIPLTFRSNVPADKLLALIWKEQVKKDLSECLTIKTNGVESTTVYKQLSKGSFTSVMLDWTGSYPDPESYLSPLLSCKKLINQICKEGEAAVSGSFYGNINIQKALQESERLSGFERLKMLANAENLALKGYAYIPIWLVKPRAWSQNHLSKPIFEKNGFMRMDLLKRINK